MRLAHADGFDESESLAGLNRQCTNMYPKYFKITGIDGLPAVDKQLYGTPGITQIATTGNDDVTEINRGAVVAESLVYFVNGTTFSRLNENLTITDFTSEAILGSNKVSMSENGTQILVISPDAGTGYIFDIEAGTLTQITDEDFTANGIPQYAIFIQSFFMMTTKSKKFATSDINDGTSWGINSFGTAESNPDPIVAPLNFKNTAYIFGTQSVEGEAFVEGSDFNYVHNNVILDKGLFSPLSLQVTSNMFMWVGGAKDEQPAIWFSTGAVAEKLSNTGVDLKLKALTPIELDQITSFSYMIDGSFFIGWRLPNEAVVYEQSTGTWHLRRSEVDSLTQGWRAVSLVTAYDKLICFDAFDGRIGEISNETFSEYGSDILREFDIQPIRQGRTFTIPRVEAQIEAGVGTSTNDPKLRIKTTRDGQDFGSDRHLGMGKIGERLKRLVKRRLGRFPQYCGMRFSCSEQVKVVIIQIEAEIKSGLV